MFADRIKELRKAKKMTQKQLAEVLFVDQTAISYWEQGKTKPDFEKQQILADYFGVSVDYLLGRETSQKKEIREVDSIIEETRQELMEGSLMFDGEPLSEESIQSVLDALKVGIEIARKRNAERNK